MLDHHSPVLLLIQQIRDEAHRFAITFHRKRRQMRDRVTELRDVPGVGELTTRRLLQHFGSLHAVKQANYAALTSVVSGKQADAILKFSAKTSSENGSVGSAGKGLSRQIQRALEGWALADLNADLRTVAADYVAEDLAEMCGVGKDSAG